MPSALGLVSTPTASKYQGPYMYMRTRPLCYGMKIKTCQPEEKTDEGEDDAEEEDMEIEGKSKSCHL